MDLDTTEPSTDNRCFKLPVVHLATRQHWFMQWKNQFKPPQLIINDRQEEALARLIPTLVCGEQSAVYIFNTEKQRLSNSALSHSIKHFSDIEYDEHMHEQALNQLVNTYSKSPDAHKIKRRAQIFYARFNRHTTIADHFAHISQLDAGVCQIMHAMQDSDLGKAHPISLLFEQIKKDEARHVAISKKHALALGYDKDKMINVKEQVRSQLIQLLTPMSDSFDAFGVDPDMLFTRIKGSKY